jgi:hypothetical protein
MQNLAKFPANIKPTGSSGFAPYPPGGVSPVLAAATVRKRG